MTESPNPSTVAARVDADAADPVTLELPATLAPDRSLLKLYALTALLAGPGYPIFFAFLWLRYRTLRYDIDEQGITMSWGVLFRREVSLSFARIQDIHLSSNVVERWFRLARIQLQTASGRAAAELTIEGLRNHEALRSFLYSRMRGARDDDAPADPVGGPPGSVAASSPSDRALADLAGALREVGREVRSLREALAEATVDDAGR